ncbi:endolytic transglycosylase MltG [Pseudomonadales bacterium]|nr:endolytic transglycosylase MltG [Pseudomonadales bacterium]
MKIIKLFPVLLVVLFCSIFLLSKLFISYWHLPLEHLTEPQLYTVKSGMGFNRVVDDLSAQGVLESPLLTTLWVRIFEPNFLLKVGEYRIPALASPADIVEILGSGISLQYKITLLEGDNALQMLARFAVKDTLVIDVSSASVVSLIEDAKDEAVHLKGQELPLSQLLTELLSPSAIELMGGVVHPEGWFLPDTYFFSRDDHASSLLLRSHLAMLDVLAEEWSARDSGLPYRSAYEALIMASLIEKETGVAYERAQIAGVFVRRLHKRMRLQTDPSVIYGLGAEYTGNLRRADLKRDTVYNTYTRHGLPPTPIAMPGRAAIHAALHPLDGDSLYFVAKGDGSHYFSATLKEHQAAVRKYQIKQRRADYRSTPASIQGDAG